MQRKVEVDVRCLTHRGNVSGPVEARLHTVERREVGELLEVSNAAGVGHG